MVHFNSHTWSKYVTPDAEIPEHPHFAVMLFRDTRFTERGYDREDPDTTRTVRTMTYYAFPDKETWEKMITAWYQDKHQPRSGLSNNYDNENIVFFHSGGRGKVDVKIGVNINTQTSR